MSWRRLRTLAMRWNFWRATTPAQTKWMLTSGCSAMQWPATRVYSLARTMSKRPGALSILCSKQALSVYDYEPNSWGPREVEERVLPVGGWHNPKVAAETME